MEKTASRPFAELLAARFRSGRPARSVFARQLLDKSDPDTRENRTRNLASVQKTITRWLKGAIPELGYRGAIAEALGEEIDHIHQLCGEHNALSFGRMDRDAVGLVEKNELGFQQIENFFSVGARNLSICRSYIGKYSLFFQSEDTADSVVVGAVNLEEVDSEFLVKEHQEKKDSGAIEDWSGYYFIRGHQLVIILRGDGHLVLLSQKVADVVVFGSEPSGYGALRQFPAHRGCDGPSDW